ncbi:aspartic peptidase domain-containing protein [Xylariaceae sp. FL0804]|nr:aspartic peptidase domain-containing protein [Xylariaceae sp. FL0804]
MALYLAMAFILRKLTLSFFLFTTLVHTDCTFKLLWSTDEVVEGEGLIGPDGPWQAISLDIGYENYTSNTTYMWPSGSSMVEVLMAMGGGNYTAVNATFPYVAPCNSCSNAGPGVPEENDLWGGSSILQPASYGEYVYDGVGLFTSDYEDHIWLNGSILALREWSMAFPNGRRYNASAGLLGLGPSDPVSDDPPCLLQQLKNAGRISSLFCGLHMGSALLGQQGSMVLGGYEQNRVLGDVGTFGLTTYGPQAFILDVQLGVETGDSPFNFTGNTSLWHAIDDGDSEATLSVELGGRTGSRIIQFDPSVPYLYMPPGICEAVAQYLPVTWNKSLELYTWDEDDSTSDLIGSPAFMAIVLADRDARNITVKMPFLLLNLTLTEPIVDAPTQYFPCKPWNVSEIGNEYMLGRAFLQAAFLGFEFEHNLAFIAQGPGPSLEQSITVTYAEADTSVTPNALGSFESSWASTWTVLGSSDDNPASSPGGDGSDTPGPSQSSAPGPSQSSAPRHSTTSPGGIAGAVVGSVLGSAAILAAALWAWRRKRRAQTTVRASAAPPYDPTMGTASNPSELDPWSKPSEAYGNALPHEMPMSERAAPEDAPWPIHYELPSQHDP